jgi:hypothetical protein
MTNEELEHVIRTGKLPPMYFKSGKLTLNELTPYGGK